MSRISHDICDALNIAHQKGQPQHHSHFPKETKRLRGHESFPTAVTGGLMQRIRGTIARRVLVNYRIDPDRVQRLLPKPFQAQLINGYAIGGICLIRLEGMRPIWVPWAKGPASENAAHRFAVEWEADGVTHRGVYISRRETNSRWNAAIGGILFPGVHQLGEFKVMETAGRVKLDVRSVDGEMSVRVAARVANAIPSNSVFESVEAASDFFLQGGCGWSAGRDPESLEGVRLVTRNWNLTPLAVEHLRSDWFEDPRLFPKGSVEFDSAFLMRNIEHEWQVIGSPQAAIRHQPSRQP